MWWFEHLLLTHEQPMLTYEHLMLTHEQPMLMYEHLMLEYEELMFWLLTLIRFSKFSCKMKNLPNLKNAKDYSLGCFLS